LSELAEQLLDKEVIFSEDLERIFGKRKADQMKELREAEAKAALPGAQENNVEGKL
jgi:cell division protease FtsH